MRQPSELPGQLHDKPFTVAEARAAGLSRRRTRARDLASPCHGVRAAAAVPDTLLDRVHALVAVTCAVASHLTAALLWGFPLPAALAESTAIHLTCLPGQRAVRRKNVVGHQLALGPQDVVFGSRVKCTSALRTWFDLASILDLDDLVMAGDFLLRRKNPLATLDEIDDFLAGMKGQRGYRLARNARELMRANTDSPKETEVRLLLIRHGLPEPGINFPMFDETGGWIEDPDMSYEREKVAIQYDGGHHADPLQRRSDIYRDESARDAGWRVVVLTQRDLVPLAPGMEPTAVTRVRKALTEGGWTPDTNFRPIRRRRSSSFARPPTAAPRQGD